MPISSSSSKNNSGSGGGNSRKPGSDGPMHVYAPEPINNYRNVYNMQRDRPPQTPPGTLYDPDDPGIRIPLQIMTRREYDLKKKSKASIPVSSPEDKEELEADQVAEEVMTDLQPEKKKKKLSAKTSSDQVMGKGTTGGTLDAGTAEGVRNLQGKGSPLSDRTRVDMERSFGADFSGVRIHTGVEAETLSRSMNARAFTYGNNIAFNKGEYSPDTPSGKKLLAHELAHTVQQGGEVHREADDRELTNTFISQYGIYSAKKGDTLLSIAEQYNKKYGIKISGEELAELNDIRDRMEVKEGDIIVVDFIFLQSDLGRTIPSYIQEIIDRIKSGNFNNTHRHFMYLLNDKLEQDFLKSKNVTNIFYPEPGTENLYGDIYGENSKWDDYKQNFFKTGEKFKKLSQPSYLAVFSLGVLIEAFEDLYATADLGRKYITWNYDEDIKEINLNREQGTRELSQDIAKIFFKDQSSLSVAEYFDIERAGRRAFIVGGFIGGIKAALEGVMSLPRLWKRIKNLREIKFLEKIRDFDLKKLLRIGSKKDLLAGEMEIQGIAKDPRGVYGYLPEEGSRYFKFRDKFMDPEWVSTQRAVRSDYLKQSKKLEADIKLMRAQKKSLKEIAEYVVDQRNVQKTEARMHMLPEEVKALEEGNIKKYGNPIGPTADELFKKLGDWERVIESSMRKDPEINKLLGLE